MQIPNTAFFRQFQLHANRFKPHDSVPGVVFMAFTGPAGQLTGGQPPSGAGFSPGRSGGLCQLSDDLKRHLGQRALEKRPNSV